jgi:hypothetical protein
MITYVLNIYIFIYHNMHTYICIDSDVLVATFVSNCDQAGATERLAYLRELMTLVKVHIYTHIYIYGYIYIYKYPHVYLSAIQLTHSYIYIIYI